MEHARAGIIGGGVGGTSIAHHLTELGWREPLYDPDNAWIRS
jgi:glycine/D-amino acid oxidase-like deaminating enzyme